MRRDDRPLGELDRHPFLAESSMFSAPSQPLPPSAMSEEYVEQPARVNFGHYAGPGYFAELTSEPERVYLHGKVTRGTLKIACAGSFDRETVGKIAAGMLTWVDGDPATGREVRRREGHAEVVVDPVRELQEALANQAANEIRIAKRIDNVLENCAGAISALNRAVRSQVVIDAELEVRNVIGKLTWLNGNLKGER